MINIPTKARNASSLRTTLQVITGSGFILASAEWCHAQQLASAFKSLTVGHPVWTVRYSPDGHTLACVSGGTGGPGGSGEVWLWDTATYRVKKRINLKTAALPLSFSPAGNALAVGGSKGEVTLWSVPSGRWLGALSTGSTVKSLAYGAAGHLLAVGSANGVITIWNPLKGKLLHKIATGGSYAFAVAFSPDDKFLLSGGGYNDAFRIWNVSTAKLVKAVPGQGGTISAIVFARRGGLFATASWDRTVKLWTNGSYRLRKTLTGHTWNVGDIAFSHDSKMLASTSDQLILWDVPTGKQRGKLSGNLFTSVAFSPDDRNLAYSSMDGTVKISRLISRRTSPSHRTRAHRSLH